MANLSTDKINRLAPEDILLPPIELSGRKDYAEADIASLAADILKRGQDTPVKIRKDDSGKALLVFGRRRYLAVQHINGHLLGPNDKKVQLDCTYEAKMSDSEALIAAIQENSKRKDVNDMDHAANIERLRKLCKLTLEQVAEIYFPEAANAKEKSDALRWVRERASLVELADESKQAVREGTATVTAAVQLAKLPKDKQREVVAAAPSKKKVAGKVRITVADVKAHKPAPVSRRAQAAPAAPALPVKVQRVLTAAEVMACAIELYFEDATEETAAEDKMTAAVSAYRKLAPFPVAEDKAA